MGIISLAQADHLYWLGRYSERVYTTLQFYAKSFDLMIDGQEDYYPRFCESIDIPNIYSSKDDFIDRYPFSEENPDSIITNLNRAYDNAIVLRETIGSEALSYIQLAIYDMNQARQSKAPLIEIQKIKDHLLSFWGIIDDQVESEQIRNIIKAGKRIERIDLYARLGMPRNELQREVRRMTPRVEKSGLHFNRECLRRVNHEVDELNVDYYGIVSDVEAII